MTAAERAEMLITARLLQAAERIDWLSTALTSVGAMAVVFAPPTRMIAAVTIVLGLLEKLYAVRVSFDARLFEDLAGEAISATDVDSALTGLALAPRNKSGRTWTDRCRGAKRLVFASAALTVVQALAIIVIGFNR